jgi:peptidoglycan hydrolase-like protein with peptidoglycan-binding domain
MARPELNRGDTGDDVRYLQERIELHLRDAGIQLSAIDGDFGPITEESVKYFQRVSGLGETGVVDDRTWEFLESEPSTDGDSSGATGATDPSGPPSGVRLRPLDLSVPYSLKLHWDDTTLNQMNLDLQSLDLRTQPGSQLTFLQPVGKLFGNGGVEALNLELQTWPNWFLTWSVQAVAEWDQQHGPVLGADNEVQLGIRPLRGVDLTVTGNLDLRWQPLEGTGSAEPSGTVMININILELLPH